MLGSGVTSGLTATVVLLLVATAVTAGPDVRQTVDDVIDAAGISAHDYIGLASDSQAPPESRPYPSQMTSGTVPPEPSQPVVDEARAVEARAQRFAERVAQSLPDVIDVAQALQREAEETAKQIQVPELLPLEPAPVQEQETAPATQAATPMLETPLAQAIMVATVAGAAAVAVWLAAGSSGTVGAGAATKGAADLRRLLPYASPLFTRFERDTVLGHPRREALYAMILQTPGISLQALGDATGLSRTATLHHLRLMEKQHLIVSKRMGRSRHFYENGGRFGRDQKEAFAVLQNARSRDVANYIQAHPGAHQKELCEALAIPPSIAHWHVRRLQQATLVESRRDGRNVTYMPGPSLADVVRQGVMVA